MNSHCPTCQGVTAWTRARHRSGEMMWLCTGCYQSWKAKLPATKPLPTKRNPSRRIALSPQAKKAAKLAAAFHGRPARPDEIEVLTKPKIPDSLARIGSVFAITYIAERDGKQAKYQHVFKAAKSRPHLLIAPDGKQVFMLGGAWKFGEDGFEDQ